MAVNTGILCIPTRIFGLKEDIRANFTETANTRYHRKGGVLDATVESTLRCKFPTYVRFDWDKIYVPEGKDVTVQLEEGFVIEGEYFNSTRERIPAVPNLVTFRTPYRGLARLTTQVAIEYQIERFRPFVSNQDIFSQLQASAILNPGKLAALLVELFQLQSIIGSIKPFFADIQSEASVASIIGFIKEYQADISASASISDAVFGYQKLGESSITSEANLTAELRLKPLVDMETEFTILPEIKRIRETSADFAVTSTLATAAINVDLIRSLRNPNVTGTKANDRWGQSVTASRGPGSLFDVVASAPGDNSDRGFVRFYTAIGLSDFFQGQTIPSFTLNARLGSIVRNSLSDEVNYTLVKNNATNTYQAYSRSGTLVTTYSSLGTRAANLTDPSSYGGKYVSGTDIYNLSGNSLYKELTITGTIREFYGDYILIDDSGSFSIYDIENETTVCSGITNPNPGLTGTRFGASVDIDGNYIIIGDPLSGLNTGGKAYIFDIQSGNLLHTLDYPGPTNLTGLRRFGQTVSISRSIAMISSPSVGRGMVHAFSAVTGDFIITIHPPLLIPGTTLNSEVRFFGDSMSFENDILVVGAPRSTDEGLTDAGLVQVYRIRNTFQRI
jgi:hypothetical protein